MFSNFRNPIHFHINVKNNTCSACKALRTEPYRFYVPYTSYLPKNINALTKLRNTVNTKQKFDIIFKIVSIETMRHHL